MKHSQTNRQTSWLLLFVCLSGLQSVSMPAIAAHPCLLERTSAPLQSGSIPSSPFILKSAAAPDYILEGLVPDILPDKKLEKGKLERILTLLKNHASTASIHIYAPRQPDRYGRQPAFISLASANDGKGTALTLLQEHLLAEGLARLIPEQVSQACAEQLAAIEHTARTEKRGLWKLPFYQIRNAATLPLSATLSTYQIIRGQPISISRNPGGTSYLNFGHHWQRDFTVTLDKKVLALWEKNNKLLDELADAPIYVRGWIEDRGGPMIRLSNPNQLQPE